MKNNGINIDSNKTLHEEIGSVIETFKNDIAILKKKLSSKNEALIIMNRELDTCQLERDQFKLMAEQVQQRYQDLRKSLLSGAHKIEAIDEKHAKLTTQQLISLLHESREANKVLQFELEEKKRKLFEYQGDIKLLREQLTRKTLGVVEDGGISIRNFPQHERAALVERIEEVTDKHKQLRRDLEQCLDEKEELVTERDVYKTKYEKLNSEINYILKGDSKEMIDVDALILENKLLKDQVNMMEAERSEAVATMSKYRNMIDKKKPRQSVTGMDISSITTSPTHDFGVQSFIAESVNSVIMTPQAASDLQVLTRGLLETINDKNLALSHQRKANKLLADKFTELEKKLKTLEMSGLWNLVDYKVRQDVSDSIEKLKMECDNVKKCVSVEDNSYDENTHDSESGGNSIHKSIYSGIEEDLNYYDNFINREEHLDVFEPVEEIKN